jgi:hypothetical protein
MYSGNLFHKIDLTADIDPEGWRLNPIFFRSAFLRCNFHPQASENICHVRGRDVRPQQRIDFPATQVNFSDRLHRFRMLVDSSLAYFPPR